VVILQNDEPDAPGAIAVALRQRGVEVTLIRPFVGPEERVPEAPGDEAGLVVLGGAMASDDDGAFPFLAAERRLLRATVDAGRPVLGVCLGAQLLARALGGDVAPGRVKEIGWHAVEKTTAAEGDALFAELPARFTPFHWHGDQIEAPPGAAVLARSAISPVQAFRIARAYGVQFHLEADAAIVQAMADDAPEELREVGSDRSHLRDETRAHLDAQARMAALFFGAWARLVAP
jgi:GMP synthase (glutamine-hydrolysing)